MQVKMMVFALLQHVSHIVYIMSVTLLHRQRQNFQLPNLIFMQYITATADCLGMQDDMEKDAKARKTARKHTVLYNKVEGNIPRKFTCQMKEPVCIYKVHRDFFARFLLTGSLCLVHCVCVIHNWQVTFYIPLPLAKFFFCMPHARLHKLRGCMYACLLV